MQKRGAIDLPGSTIITLAAIILLFAVIAYITLKYKGVLDAL